jgi:uncharacterized protein (TIGR02996 family)
VTTEDDFQRAIDARLDDFQTRLVFADWLDERGDPRADGYRALGLLRLCPFVDTTFFWWTSFDAQCCPRSGLRGNGCSLPDDWFELVEIDPRNENFKPYGLSGVTTTRREAEDAAALAFSLLPPERRAELFVAPAPPRPQEPPRGQSKK